jgi:hypothetical protein
MDRERMSQGRALLSGVLILLYFAIFTAWLPSFLLRSPLLRAAPRNVADGVTVVIWGGFFVAGAWGLRRAQARGWI